MRKAISNDTGKEVPFNDKGDVTVDGDGEGGIILGMCWHEMKNLGSVAVRIKSDRCAEFIQYCQKAMGDRDA